MKDPKGSDVGDIHNFIQVRWRFFYYFLFSNIKLDTFIMK